MNTLAGTDTYRQSYSMNDQETTNGITRNEALVGLKSHPDRNRTTIIVSNRVIVIAAAPITSMANNVMRMHANVKWLVWIVRVIPRLKIPIHDEDQKHEITINLNQVNEYASIHVNQREIPNMSFFFFKIKI